MREQGNSKSRFAGFLKKIGTSLLKLFRGDFLVYLLFLAITFFFWWSQTMSQEFQSVIKLPVRLTGISDDIRAKARYSQIGCFYLDNNDGTYRKMYDRFVIRNKHPEEPKGAVNHAD